MFEVGENYMFWMVDGSGESGQAWTVAAVNLPLLKLNNEHDARKSIIFNTASSQFIRAEPLKAQGKAR